MGKSATPSATSSKSLIDASEQLPAYNCPGSQNNSNSLVSRKLFWVLTIHPKFSAINFLSYLFAVFFTIFFLAFISASTAGVVRQLLHYEHSEGTPATILSISDEAVTCVAAILWGAASDRIGRRSIYTMAFLFMGVGLALSPLSTQLWHLVLCRLVFAVGGAAGTSMMTAVLGDCTGKLRGRIAGLVGTFSGLGAVVSVFSVVPMPENLSKKGISLAKGVQYSYWLTAALSVMYAMVYRFTASDYFGSKSCPAARNDRTVEIANTRSYWARCKDILVHSLQGFKAARNPRIAAAYMAGFAARGNTVVITLYVPFWFNKYYQLQGLCPNGDMSSSDMKNNCAEAYKISHMLQGSIQVVALCAAPLWGILSDKLGMLSHREDEHNQAVQPVEQARTTNETSRLTLTETSRNVQPRPQPKKYQYATMPLLITCILATLGYALLAAAKDPRKKANYGIGVLVGIGEIGTVITSLAMVASADIPAQDRGTISGAYSLCGALGIIIAVSISGAVFDAGFITGPFAVMAIVHLVVGIMAAAVIFIDAKARSSN